MLISLQEIKRTIARRARSSNTNIWNLSNKKLEVVSPTQWMKYDHVHTLSAAYEALPPDAIVALNTPSWTRPMYPNLVKMGT